jgi:hypothetical protein
MLWVDGHKIGKLDVPIEAAAAKPYAEDDVVRDLRTWEEALAFAANTTDYIGNLAGPVAIGTWVRYDTTDLNIIGENHTYVTLDQITTAVGTQNFIYERFGADALLPLRAGPVFRVIGGGGLAVQVSGAVRLQEQGDVPVSAGARVACGLRGFLMAGKGQRSGGIPVGRLGYRDESLVGVR